MGRFLIPDFVFDRFSDITPAFLAENRICALLCDIDNTLSPYEDALPSEAVRAWVSRLADCGVRIALISNNSAARVEQYNSALSVPAYADSKKPCRAPYRAAMEALGVPKEQCAVLGDQLFTDVWSAQLVGIRSIVVPPIRDKKTLFFRLKRALEMPFMKRYYRLEKKADDR